MAELALPCSVNVYSMQCSVFPYSLLFIPLRDGEDSILWERESAHLLQYDRGYAHALVSILFSPSMRQELHMSYHHCKLIASGVARLHGDLLLVQQSYPGDPHLTGDCQVDRLSQEKSLLLVSNASCLRKRALPLLEHQRLLSFSRCFARQRRVSRNGSCVILRAKWPEDLTRKILMA